jgi:ribosomal protein S18 acetylase RimI-like enzyme
MLSTSTAKTTTDLQQILDLQEENLINNISDMEMKSEGFVTMHHSMGVLKQMHDLSPSIIIKDNNKIVAYALVMLRECRQLFPPLEPMFAVFDNLKWNNKPMNDQRFYAIGQICIARSYRGQGLFEMLYEGHKKRFCDQFDFIVTEISTRNPRSLRAHERVGFKTIHIYKDELDEWAVVLWDWKKN